MARTARFTFHLNVLVDRRTADWLHDVAENEEKSVSEIVRGILSEEARRDEMDE